MGIKRAGDVDVMRIVGQHKGGFRFRVVLVALGLGTILIGSSPANAATFSSNLSAEPNGSVCSFQSLEPRTHVCTVGQRALSGDHTATAGLVAPFDGVIVRWSVVSGTAPPGTGVVKLALRTTHGPGYMEKGPEVELPSSPPGTRHTFAERMPVSASQPIGMKITISNRSTQEAGAPIAFREDGVGLLEIWANEPWESSWTTEENVELLLNAEIEPDADQDGYGDLTQDCSPSGKWSQSLCLLDLDPPTIRLRFAKRQPFLRSGRIFVRVGSNEAGVANAEGQLEIKGRGGWNEWLPRVRKPVAAGAETTLELRVPKRLLKAARTAKRAGKKILVTVPAWVTDTAGNPGGATARIHAR